MNPMDSYKPPPPLPWAVSMQHKQTHQWPGPNAIQAQQAPLPPPPAVPPPPLLAPEPSAPPPTDMLPPMPCHCRSCCPAAALPLPRQRPLKQHGLPFFVWKRTRGGTSFGKAGVVNFRKLKVIQTYECRVKWFIYFKQKIL